MIRILAALSLLASPAMEDETKHVHLKAAAVGIVANRSCPSRVFDDATIVSWLLTGSRDSGLTQEQGIEATKVYIAMLLGSIKTREQLHTFCREMVRVSGEPI